MRTTNQTFKTTLAAICFCIGLAACNSGEQPKENSNEASVASAPAPTGQSGVKDDVSQKNIVQVAAGSPDHTTLVTAVKTAELVDVLSNAGPFTVFAPTNAAFDKLPKGTVDDLLKPEKRNDLQNILQYHVSVAVYKAENFRDGQVIGQVNGDNITMGVKDGKVTVNGATILASIPASNGIIHVIDGVLLPPAKK
jgi:uncharacterized surface protein with fasciclin (FAS1) repeats